MIQFYEGHEFVGPNGKSYRLTRDVSVGDYIQVSDFEPFGDAEKPVAGAEIPHWLCVQLKVY